MFAKQPDTWFNKERIELFYDMIIAARTFDVESGQPDCEDLDKAKLEERIAELEAQLTNKE